MKFSLQFPILAFGYNQTLPVHHRDEESLMISTDFDLKYGYFKNLLIVDSEGKKYLVKSARKTGYVSCLSLSNLLGFTRRLIKVDIELAQIGELSLEEFKQHTYSIMEKDVEIWEGGNEDLKEYQLKIENAKTHKEVIQAIWEEF